MCNASFSHAAVVLVSIQDYIVLLPQAYYEGAVLQDRLRNPCMVPSDGRECLHYTYVDLSKYPQVDGADATRPDNDEVTLETNRDILLPLNSPNLAQVPVIITITIIITLVLYF